MQDAELDREPNPWDARIEALALQAGLSAEQFIMQLLQMPRPSFSAIVDEIAADSPYEDHVISPSSLQAIRSTAWRLKEPAWGPNVHLLHARLIEAFWDARRKFAEADARYWRERFPELLQDAYDRRRVRDEEWFPEFCRSSYVP